MPTRFAAHATAQTRPGDQRESGAAVFLRTLRTTTGITEAGLAEIKPHNPPAIRKGLAQLRDYLQQSEARRLKNKLHEPKRESVWLITYLPTPENTTSPKEVRIFAHKLRREDLLKPGKLPALDSLLLSKQELPPVTLPATMPFPNLTKPDMFGLAIEECVRQRFGDVYKRPRNKAEGRGRKGADVLWRELADFYRELANETGERYWGELADELWAEG